MTAVTADPGADADTPETPGDYVVGHVKAALACDPRVAVLDLTVEVFHDHVVVTGRVETPARRAAVDAVVRELLPHHRFDNGVTVAATGHGPALVEELP